MNKRLLGAIRRHVVAEYPKEACGLVIVQDDKETYIPCHNIAEDPESIFILDPHDYAKADADGDIVMLVHSHPEHAARPSEGDRVSCEESGLPWMIVSVYKDLITGELNAQDYTITNPSGYQAPLVGRRWCPPQLDCYGLIRDYYKQELGIALANFEIQKRADKWWEDSSNSSLYLDHFEEAGFVRVFDGPKLHDVIFMELGSEAGPNHAGIYLGDSTGYMLHHLCDRLSNRVVYGGYYLDHTRMIVRHKELL